MIINTQNLILLAQGFNAAFMRGIEAAPPTYMQVAMEVNSMGSAENYGWMKDLPGMREWVGKRVINNLESVDYQIANKHFEHTIGVNKNDIADDRLGIYTTMFAQQGEIAASHPDGLVWNLLPNGFAAKGFDGQYFFDTDHVTHNQAGAEISWSNTGGGSGAPWFLLDLSRTFTRPVVFQKRAGVKFTPMNKDNDENVFMENKYLFGADARYNAGYGFHQLAYGSKQALDATTYEAAKVALASQRRPDGQKMAIKGTHLVVGASNEAKARTLLNTQQIAGGGDNIWFNTAQLIVCPWLD
ncbi:Mu-like prophage major head subunit gpT family protein [Denitromonas halophila]|uniref:Bacteriophage Mu GpT domain-containing protein n=1 Tax=Denitromonas halophila TaxID=1629404 RepID=A0A557QX88_9RHOO|nr:Mu-like prophage major head subunit gpT family protein [Denitromonas halophila]TVO57534.1 hypothetical protein FHP91_07610 [Denitromonas halophila]